MTRRRIAPDPITTPTEAATGALRPGRLYGKQRGMRGPKPPGWRPQKVAPLDGEVHWKPTWRTADGAECGAVGVAITANERLVRCESCRRRIRAQRRRKR